MVQPGQALKWIPDSASRFRDDKSGWGASTRNAAILAIGLFVAACGQKEAAAPIPAPAASAKVFAAASLTDVLGQVGDAYAAQGGVKPTLVFAASSDLARQIEQGAEADVFMSADEDWMNYLAERSLIDPASRVDLLTNKLVLIAPANWSMPPVDPSKFKRVVTSSVPENYSRFVSADSFHVYLGGGKLAMADPDSVPAGKYGKEALSALNVWAELEKKTARGESVRAALRFVEAGEANLGIVYATDAKAAGDRVLVLEAFDPATHTPIVYPIATIAGRDSGKDFAAFLQSQPARDIFTTAGFGVAAK